MAEYRESIAITAMGANTPVGRSAEACAAAVRAGISRCGEHPFIVDMVGEPMRVARAPWIDLATVGAARLEALLVPALDQVLASLTRIRSTIRVSLLLGLPSPRPGLPADLVTHVETGVKNRYLGRFASITSFAAGHAAGLLATQEACQQLASNTQAAAIDACVVAGVDSYLDPHTLEWLETSEQLHGAGPLMNAWGFIPGEAAGALVLLAADRARAWDIKPLATVLGLGSALEQNPIKTQTVCLGEGLTQALRQALEGLPTGAQVADIYCDMNGEPYRADEFGFATLRTREGFISPSDFLAPADCWGDVGAAGGPLHMILASVAGLKGYARGSCSLVWASSELGERAAVLLGTPRAKG